MMIIDPVALGDVASSRPSAKNVYDKAGTLVTVPANQGAVTYDPSNLSAAPYVVSEGASVNGLRSSCSFADPVWTKRGTAAVLPNQALAPDGSISMDLISGLGANGGSDIYQTVGSVQWASGTQINPSLFIKKVSAAGTLVLQNAVNGANGLWSVDLSKVGTGIERITRNHPAVTVGTEFAAAGNISDGLQMYCTAGAPLSFYAWDAELATGVSATSPWPTNPTFVSRASTATFWDATGTLQTAAANVGRTTYNPGSLTTPPRLLVENASTNYFPNSSMAGAGPGVGPTTWNITGSLNGITSSILGSGTEDGIPYVDVRLQGTASASTQFGMFPGTGATQAATVGNAFTVSAFLRLMAGSFAGFTAGSPEGLRIFEQGGGVNIAFHGSSIADVTNAPLRTQRRSLSWQVTNAAVTQVVGSLTLVALAGQAVDVTLRIGAPQFEPGLAATSPILTTNAAATRAADVVSYSQTRAADSIGAGAGLVYSSVALTETAYSMAATYAQGDSVYDPASYLMYQSLINANTGKALTDTTAWTPLNKSVNRWQMFDSYNNTQTSNAEEIIVVLSPLAISRGVYLANLDANEVRVSVVDLTEGLVYREAQNLIASDSGSSFYNYAFKRIRRKSYAVSVALPPYANALVTIAIKKPGGTAKCGVCVVGPLVDIGLSQYGISREIKDYSTINFNFDGTSNVQLRNFAKRMDIDVIVDNTQVDSVTEALESYRQKPVAWIGAAAYGSACVFGRYSSFKNVIAYPTESNMNLQIEGTV